MPPPFFFGLRRLWLDLPLLGKGLSTVGIPVTLVATGLTLLSSGTQQDTAAIEAMDHGAMIRTALNAVLTDLLTAESEARGYVVSGRFDFSARSNAAQNRLPADLDQVAELTGGSEDELVAALKVAVEEKLAAIAAVLRGAGSPKAGSEGMLWGEEVMARVREKLAAVEGLEVTRQAAGLARHREIRRITMRWGVLTMVLGLSSTLGAIFFSSLSLRRRVRSMQMSVRALKMEAPLVAEETSADEIGQLQAELERTSEVMASRVEELRESEGQLRTIIDHTSAIVYIKDLDSSYLMVNRAYEEIFGLDSAQVVGKRPVDLFGEDYGGRLRANDLAVLKSGKPAQFEECFQRNGKVYTYISVKAPLLGPGGRALRDLRDLDRYHGAKNPPAPPRAGLPGLEKPQPQRNLPAPRPRWRRKFPPANRNGSAKWRAASRTISITFSPPSSGIPLSFWPTSTRPNGKRARPPKSCALRNGRPRSPASSWPSAIRCRPWCGWWRSRLWCRRWSGCCARSSGNRSSCR